MCSRFLLTLYLSYLNAETKNAIVTLSLETTLEKVIELGVSVV